MCVCCVCCVCVTLAIRCDVSYTFNDICMCGVVDDSSSVGCVPKCTVHFELDEEIIWMRLFFRCCSFRLCIGIFLCDFSCSTLLNCLSFLLKIFIDDVVRVITICANCPERQGTGYYVWCTSKKLHIPKIDRRWFKGVAMAIYVWTMLP